MINRPLAYIKWSKMGLEKPPSSPGPSLKILLFLSQLTTEFPLTPQLRGWNFGPAAAKVTVTSGVWNWWGQWGPEAQGNSEAGRGPVLSLSRASSHGASLRSLWQRENRTNQHRSPRPTHVMEGGLQRSLVTCKCYINTFLWKEIKEASYRYPHAVTTEKEETEPWRRENGVEMILLKYTESHTTPKQKLLEMVNVN